MEIFQYRKEIPNKKFQIKTVQKSIFSWNLDFEIWRLTTASNIFNKNF
tara:strand:+ start:689 stop:832 length:144 start_codon:yes stop_codon:yes gene_type:complete